MQPVFPARFHPAPFPNAGGRAGEIFFTTSLFRPGFQNLRALVGLQGGYAHLGKHFQKPIFTDLI